ncbi:MAG: trehalose-binding protein [Deltaproteobacteria bacterium]|nr:trehalose-binding protein [Deltaproteobacteria bacterium]
MKIGKYSLDEYSRLVESFHGFAAPGVLMGGLMVELASRNLPEGELFDAISETPKCLPDAIQLLSPATVGNGWLKILNLSRYALSFYEKFEGHGIRVFVDSAKLEPWPEVKNWFFKLVPKREQDSDRLRDEIKEAGFDIYSLQRVTVHARFLEKRSRGKMVTCPICGEAYPSEDGGICRGCQGETPYIETDNTQEGTPESPFTFVKIPVQEAVGRRALHDMTMIIPGESKGPAFKHGQEITVGDLCRLQQMGRRHLYVEEDNIPGPEWIHEDQAALAFGRAMSGQGVTFKEPPSEGKVNFLAERDGLFVVDEDRLEQFNLVPGVMCATRQNYSLVTEEGALAGSRAIPLFLPKNDFQKALTTLGDESLFRVLPLRQASVGILVTGTEVFQGLIKDKFVPIIREKVEKLGCRVVQSLIVPDDRDAICRNVERLVDAGIDLLITTAGLSVDPDDVTRQALMDAGTTDMVYGAPVLPGAMTLLAKLGAVQVIGVPACALYFKTTSLDLFLPRLLAGLEITRRDLAKMGNGAFCLTCKTCTYPKCPFGK